MFPVPTFPPETPPLSDFPFTASTRHNAKDKFQRSSTDNLSPRLSNYPQLVWINISPADKTLNHIPVFALTFWRDWLLQSNLLLYGKKKIPFLKIKPFFLEKPVQFCICWLASCVANERGWPEPDFSFLIIFGACLLPSWAVFWMCLFSFSLFAILTSLFFLFWVCCIFYFGFASALCFALLSWV